MVKAVEWTIKNGQNPASMLDYLKMPESTIIRVALRRWGTTATGYDSVLSDAGWVQYNKGTKPENGDVAIVSGAVIIAYNLATHLPRDLIQLLAFRENDDWQVCTDMGMSPINWQQSQAFIWKMYRCQPS